jgi:hypothetical protein
MMDFFINVFCGCGIFCTGMLLGSYFTSKAIQKVVAREIENIYREKNELDS